MRNKIRIYNPPSYNSMRILLFSVFLFVNFHRFNMDFGNGKNVFEGNLLFNLSFVKNVTTEKSQIVL